MRKPLYPHIPSSKREPLYPHVKSTKGAAEPVTLEVAKEPWQMTREELDRSVKDWTYYDSLYRSGKTLGDYPYFSTDIMAADLAGFPGKRWAFHGVLFENPLRVDSIWEASTKLLGKNIYPKGEGIPGKKGIIETKILDADKTVAKAAKDAGYDVISMPYEVVVLDKSRLPAGVSMTGKEWEGMGHEAIVKRALKEGKSVPSEVLAEYPELKIRRR